MIGAYLNIFKHKGIIAYYQGFTAGSGNVSQNNFLGFDIWKLLLKGIVCHIGIEI